MPTCESAEDALGEDAFLRTAGAVAITGFAAGFGADFEASAAKFDAKFAAVEGLCEELEEFKESRDLEFNGLEFEAELELDEAAAAAARAPALVRWSSLSVPSARREPAGTAWRTVLGTGRYAATRKGSRPPRKRGRPRRRALPHRQQRSITYFCTMVFVSSNNLLCRCTHTL